MPATGSPAKEMPAIRQVIKGHSEKKSQHAGKRTKSRKDDILPIAICLSHVGKEGALRKENPNRSVKTSITFGTLKKEIYKYLALKCWYTQKGEELSTKYYCKVYQQRRLVALGYQHLAMNQRYL